MSSEVFGKARWDRAIERAAIGEAMKRLPAAMIKNNPVTASNVKLACYTLAGWIDWKPTGVCDRNGARPIPSVREMAKAAEMSPRTMYRAMDVMKLLGILTRAGKRGHGVRDPFRMHFDALRRLDPNTVTGTDLSRTKGDTEEGEACQPESAALPTAPLKHDTQADTRQDSDKTASSTTTTTTEEGGGGGRAARADWVERLVTAGVSRREAPELARLPHLTDDQIAFAEDQADERDDQGKLGIRGRFIAKLLRMTPADLDGYEVFRAKRLARRSTGYKALLRVAGTTTPERGRAVIEADFELIGEVWPNEAALAEHGPFSHDELCAGHPDSTAMFRALMIAAKVELSRRGGTEGQAA